MAYTQANRLIAFDTPLGEDVLLLQGFSGHEGLSRLFAFQVDLLTEDTAIACHQLVGQRVTLRIGLADESQRSINGFVSRFTQRGCDARFTYYRAEVVPWLWFLTQTADCRIFQNMTIPEIIMQVFTDLGFRDVRNALEGSFEPRDYCVQYRETDFNFVSRLMEHAGIFYFFEHTPERHTLVLANSPTVHLPCPGQEYARYDYSAGAVLAEDVMSTWQLEQELRPGKYALADYNFETPTTSLMAHVTSTVRVGSNGTSNAAYEIYDYPGTYQQKGQGEELVRLRIEEEETSHLVASGSSTCRAFLPGYRFDLLDHPSPEMNQPYVLTEVQHLATMGGSYLGATAQGAESYTNQVTCIPYGVPFRPPRVTLKPTVQGPQTAVVVGKAGEEIWTDKYGRVKVQFHWDRQGKHDENSSCWIRVSHPWAGKGWGAISIPRLGQEVIVDFLEGDPDQPIITGRVYNAMQMPPYALPAQQTQSGVKSRSTKGGTPDNFNELRFEDQAGSEEIFLHAEKDWNIRVKNAETETVGATITTNAGGNISRNSGASISRTADQNITDKAGVSIITESGQDMSLQAGGSYQLHTNLGIHLKAMNFVAALIESGAKAAAAAITKGLAATGVAAAAAYAQGRAAGDADAAKSAAGNQLAAGAEATGYQALAALSPGIEAGAAELTRLSAQASQRMDKLSEPVSRAMESADKLGKAIESGASPEAIAGAFMTMADAVATAFNDAKALVEGLLPQIPSIVMWAMKDINAHALWSMELSTRVKNISIEAKNKDVNVKAKKNLNLEAVDQNLNLKASTKDVLLTGKEKVTIKSETQDLVIEAEKTKVTIKAKKELCLRCGSASITLDDDGNVLIGGKNIYIKASKGTNVKGNPIKLN